MVARKYVKRDWVQVREQLASLGVDVSELPESGRPQRVNEVGVWIHRCPCGRPWAPTLSSVLKRIAVSCGKCETPTVGELTAAAESRGLRVVAAPGDPESVALTTRAGERCWRLACPCGKEFDASTQQLRDHGGVSTCGCYRGIHPASKYTFADVRARCAAVGMEFLSDVPDGTSTYDVTYSGAWKFRCRCGRVFSPGLQDFLTCKVRSCGCVRSFAQGEVATYVESLGFEVSVNNRRVIPPLEIDVYVPSLKVGIEYNGLHWHGEKLRGPGARRECARKHELARQAGIRLVTVFEDEWLERQDQVRGYLAAVLGKKRSVGARKCQVVRDDRRLRDFVEDHHLQGGAGGDHYGLVLNGEVVAVAVFARQNASRNTQGGWELARYCVGEVSVVGGLSRLLRAWVASSRATRVTSYSDNRWSDGALYRALGFRKEGVSRPSYWYFKKSEPRRWHRFTFRKSRAAKLFGCLPGETEWGIMQRAGYDRVWDAGATRWVLDFS